MKIVAISGEDTKQSRARFSQITKGVKKKSWEVVYLDPKKDFEIQLTNKSLFGDENLYIIEEFSKLTPTQIDWLKKNQSKYDSQLLIYSKKNIHAATLKKISKDIKSEKFDVNKLVFKFTESLVPGNSEKALQLLTDITNNGEPMELIISLIATYFRDILWVLHGSQGMTYPDWRLKKLQYAANKFTKSEVEDILMTLADIDYTSKTTEVKASLLLEVLIAEKL